MTTHVELELARQPEAWRVAAAAFPLHEAALPARGARVAVVGCGTSLYMARAWSALREAAGHGETDAFAASEYRFDRSYDHVVAISRSGTTTEVLSVLERLGGDAPTTAVTVDEGLAIAAADRHTIALTMAAEESVVQTVFPTTVLALVRASLGDDVEGVAATAERALTDPLPVDPAVIEQVTFVGAGWAGAIAEEAALKCHEAAGFWTRGLSGDGVPARPDQRERAGHRRLGLR